MEVIDSKIQISETFKEVEDYSHFSTNTRDRISDNFLDKILDLQKNINEDASFFEKLYCSIEKITWFDTLNLDHEFINKLRELIEITRKIHGHIIRDYVYLKNNANKFASKELKRLKLALDDIKELVNDVESIFFTLPHNNAFQKANFKIQKL